MLSLFDRYPKLAQAVVAVLAARARMLVGMVEDLSLRSVAGRLAKLLLDQALQGNDAVPLTRQQMAARLGTIREMVSRALRELEDEGLVRREGRANRHHRPSRARTPVSNIKRPISYLTSRPAGVRPRPHDLRSPCNKSHRHRLPFVLE